jgi:hypothetical protein
MELEIRKIITTIEEIRFEGFKELEKPIKRVAVSAVIKNPFAGS